MKKSLHRVEYRLQISLTDSTIFLGSRLRESVFSFNCSSYRAALSFLFWIQKNNPSRAASELNWSGLNLILLISQSMSCFSKFKTNDTTFSESMTRCHVLTNKVDGDIFIEGSRIFISSNGYTDSDLVSLVFSHTCDLELETKINTWLRFITQCLTL